MQLLVDHEFYKSENLLIQDGYVPGLCWSSYNTDFITNDTPLHVLRLPVYG